MRKMLGISLALIMMIVPIAMAYVTAPTPIGIILGTEPFTPSVWQCGAWLMTDDPAETGRVSNSGEQLIERSQSYIFNGEQLAVKVLVLDKNGMEKVLAPDVIVNGQQETNCHLDKIIPVTETLLTSCNAKLGEETFIKPPATNTMGYYTCVLTAEPTESMYGSLPITVKVTDLDGKSATTAEVLNYFFNPAISLSVLGAINFGQNVRPGTQATSPTIVVKSQSEGGVMLDMFIVGKDFYDPNPSGALCQGSNSLKLSNFRYYATNGAYSTSSDPRADVSGYVPINYCLGSECAFTPAFYNTREIIQANPSGAYWLANQLANGAGISMTFRLSLPVPCNGNFNDGAFYISGEAI